MATGNTSPRAEFRMGFRSADVQSKNVDFESYLIKDVVLAQVGEAQGHRFHVEKSALESFAKSAKKGFKKGLPCRFGHNYNNLGKNLGRFSNIRVVGNKLLGDVKLYKSADASPSLPGMASYVMKMAQEDAMSIMLSIRFRMKEFYQYDKSGARLRVRYYDEDLNWVGPIKEFGKVYVDIGEAVSCDVVDEGALTISMFSTDTIDKSFSHLASLPEFSAWVENNIESIPAINDHFAVKQDNSILSKITNFFNMSKNNASAESNEEAEDEAKETQATEAGDVSNLGQFQALSDRLDALEGENGTLKSSNTSLQERINALENLPAASETRSSSATEELDGQMSYLDDPINQRAVQMFSSQIKTVEKS